MSLKLKTYSNCIPVRGYCRSVIYDLQRNNYSFIPNSLQELIRNHDGKELSEIKYSYNNKYDDVINDYVTFLLENEFAFFTSSPQLFPNLNIEFKFSSIVSNSIICNQYDRSKYSTIFTLLENLNCKAIQLRLFIVNTWNELTMILNYAEYSRLQHIELIIPYFKDKKLDDYKKLVHQYNRIWIIRIFNSPFNKIEFIDEQKKHPILYIKNKIKNNSFCGNIHPNNFVQNIPFFTESQHYNTCLNRKVCIDEDGYIKNCLSMDKHYGNIKDVDLKEVVSSKEFQKLWHIKKDEIKVCKDCEFRHMCMDCRAYIKDPDDIYSQPAKCNYNPYIAKWKGQDGYITVEQWQKNKESNLK